MNILNANWIRTGSRALDGPVEGLELEQSSGYFFRGRDLGVYLLLLLLLLLLLFPLVDVLEEVELSSSVVALLPSSLGSSLSAGLFVSQFCAGAGEGSQGLKTRGRIE